MGNERWQSRTNCEMANAAQTDIKYAGWTQDCWPKTELKTNFLVPQQQLKLTDGPGEEDCHSDFGGMESKRLPHSGTALAFHVFICYFFFFVFVLWTASHHRNPIRTELMELWQRKLPFVSFLFINGLVLQGKNAAWNAIALIDEILQIASTRLYWWLFHDQRNMTTNFVPAS